MVSAGIVNQTTSRRSNRLPWLSCCIWVTATATCLAALLAMPSADANPVLNDQELAFARNVISDSDRSPAILHIHHLTKRSFFNIQCKGVYDKSIFARLDRICEDCYNLFREPQLHTLCRKNCFTTDYFKGCLEALQLTDEMEQIQTWIKQLHGAEPEV